MGLYLVKLSERHAVNEFGEISGVLYSGSSFDEVWSKLNEYTEYMEGESLSGIIVVKCLETGLIDTRAYGRDTKSISDDYDDNTLEKVYGLTVFGPND